MCKIEITKWHGNLKVCKNTICPRIVKINQKLVLNVCLYVRKCTVSMMRVSERRKRWREGVGRRGDVMGGGDKVSGMGLVLVK